MKRRIQKWLLGKAGSPVAEQSETAVIFNWKPSALWLEEERMPESQAW
jgi:hypothetical protein